MAVRGISIKLHGTKFANKIQWFAGDEMAAYEK